MFGRGGVPLTLTLKSPNRWGFSDARAATALLVVAAACGYVLIALPRTAIPKQTPALRCTAAELADVERKDLALAAKVPTSAIALALDALLVEQGEAEREITETVDTQTWRKGRIRDTVAAFRRAEGDAALLSMRARAVVRMQQALDLTLPPEQVQGVLGGFPTILRETMASRDGVIVAPALVVRVLYKVRWNVVMGLPPLHALERPERRAYSGWFGLHVVDGPPIARLDVLKVYAAEGGAYVNEARGVLGYVGGDPAGARRAFERADAIRPSFHLRNMARAAKRAEYTMETSPPPGG